MTSGNFLRQRSPWQNESATFHQTPAAWPCSGRSHEQMGFFALHTEVVDLPPPTRNAAAMAILTGHARVAGIIGWPVGHSRSPRLHGYWLEKHGIDGAFNKQVIDDVVLHKPELGVAHQVGDVVRAAR